MRKFLVPIIALASVAAAAPVTAQTWGGSPGYGYNQYNGGSISQRIRAVSFQIDRLSHRGALTNSENRSLRRELGYIADRAQPIAGMTTVAAMIAASSATCGTAWRGSSSGSATKPAMATAATVITTAIATASRTVTTGTTTTPIADKHRLKLT